MLLERYPRFCTTDPDEAHQALSRMFRHHRMEVIGKTFHYSVHTAALDLISISSICTPTPRDIYQESDARYCLVTLHRAGPSEHVINGRRFTVAPGQGIVRPGEAETLTRARGMTEVIAVRIPTEDLEAEARLLMGGRYPGIPFEIAGAFDGRGLVGRMIDNLVRELDDPAMGLDMEPDLTVQQIQLALITAVIQHTPNTYQELLQQKFSDEPGRIVREATQYMARHLHQHRDLGRLARALRVGERRLERAFKRYDREPPLTVWAEMAMDRAHWQIEHPTLTLTVAGVARAYGFDHEGRFAADYKNRFGRCPREALEEAKRRVCLSFFG